MNFINVRSGGGKFRLWLVVSFFILLGLTNGSCSKSDPSPAELLGGGSSGKDWYVLSISTYDGSQTATISGYSNPSIPTCELDNVFHFSNGSSKTYQQNDLTTCASTYPAIIEQGTWSLDQRNVLQVSGTINASTDQIYHGYDPYLGYMLFCARTMRVTSLTSTNIALMYTLSGPGTTITVTLQLKSIK